MNCRADLRYVINTRNYVRLKKPKFKISGCKYIWIRKLEFVSKDSISLLPISFKS